MFRNEGIALADWILPIAAVLTYICIFACRCRRKAKNSECVVLLLVVASTAPFLLVNHSAMTFFFLAFYFFLLKYFDDLYEKRLWKLGKSANHLAEYQPQCRLLLFFADEISKHLRKNDFYLYSPKRGKQAIQTLTVGNISWLADKHIDDVLSSFSIFDSLHAGTVQKKLAVRAACAGVAFYAWAKSHPFRQQVFFINDSGG